MPAFAMKNAFRRLRWLDSMGITLALVLVSLSIYQVFEAKQHSAQVTYAKLFIDEKQVAELEVSQRPSEKARGLMGRSTLLAGEGMLFPISPPRKVQIWMKDVNFPIDIVFIRNEKVVNVVPNAPLCLGQADCPLYQPALPVEAVVELPAGQAKALQLQIGTPVTIKPTREVSPPRMS